jgi:hypothetical protein
MRCEPSARAAGITELECNSSINAKRFHEALGFEPLCEIEIDLGLDLDFPSLRMRRSLR